MKTLFLMLAFCGVVGATPSQPNLPQNPYSEDADYWAFRACDVLIHSDHVLRCKILYKEVQHTTAPIYSIHTYYAEVLECPKGCMIGKGCVISYSQQMEDSQAVPEGRHNAAGLLVLISHSGPWAHCMITVKPCVAYSASILSLQIPRNLHLRQSKNCTRLSSSCQKETLTMSPII